MSAEDLRRAGGVEEARAYATTPSTRRCTSARSSDPNGFWGEQAKRIDWFKPSTKVKNTSLRSAQRLDQMVRGRHAQRLLQLPRPAPRRSAATRPRSSGKATTRRTTSTITYRELHDEVCRFANVAEDARRQEGRPRHHLPADDPGGGLRDARLRAHRRDPLGRVRRLLAGLARRPHRRLRLDRRHHRRRGPARRQARSRSRPTPTQALSAPGTGRSSTCSSCAAPARAVAM